MTKKQKQIYINRLKSFVWRTAGLAIVVSGGLILTAGSIYNVDWKLLLDVVVLQTIGALVNEITKFLNTGE